MISTYFNTFILLRIKIRSKSQPCVTIQSIQRLVNQCLEFILDLTVTQWILLHKDKADKPFPGSAQ